MRPFDVLILNRGRSGLYKECDVNHKFSFLSPGERSPYTHIPGLLSTLTSAPFSASSSSPLPPPSIFAVQFCSPLRGASRRVGSARGTGPRVSGRRGDRDAKGTRAAFKLAAAKRINSPGSLDLLIRAAVAFLRGLDR